MALPDAIAITSNHVDFAQRFAESHAVAGSPATNEEKIVCTLTLNGTPAVTYGIQLAGWVAFTVGTSGTATTLRIRQTNASGSVIASSGAVTGGVAATNLVTLDVQGVDLAATALALPAAVYVLTLQVTGGAAISTVSGVQLTASII